MGRDPRPLLVPTLEAADQQLGGRPPLQIGMDVDRGHRRSRGLRLGAVDGAREQEVAWDLAAQLPRRPDRAGRKALPGRDDRIGRLRPLEQPASGQIGAAVEIVGSRETDQRLLVTALTPRPVRLFVLAVPRGVDRKRDQGDRSAPEVTT